MIVYLLIILLMVILSAFFSGSEIAISSANRIRLRRSADEGNKTAALALKISEDFTSSLCAILVGNNLVNIAASTCATLICLELIGNEDVASVVATVVMTLILLIFGEILPKILFKQNADSLVKIIIFPVRVLTIIIYPIVFVITVLIRGLSKLWGKDKNDEEPQITGDELSAIIDTVEEEGVIDEDKSDLLQSTLEFPDTTVEEIMTHRVDTVFVDIDDEPENIKEIIDSSRYSRLPVYEETVDNIIGIVYLNHYYKALADVDGDITKLDVKSLIIDVPFIHKTMKLPTALKLMRQNKVHIAIVTDEFGGTMGIVTMEDILEEIVGDIWDEQDEIVSEFKKTGENTYDVSGDMNLDDFFTNLEINPGEDFECEYSTVGGWAVEMLDSQPHVGDSFDFLNLSIFITEMDDMRVTQLTVLVTPTAAEEE